MAVIGARLRELRVARGLTLSQVAEETGFAVSYLSQLERDKVSISVDNLERLARYYEVHMVHFFRGPQEYTVRVTRREEIQAVAQSEGQGPAAVTVLASGPDARLETLLVRIGPGQEEPHFRQHVADVLVYVLQGEALLISETEEEQALAAGDMAYYVNFPHRRLANASREQPLLLMVITAPPTSTLDGLNEARVRAETQG
jgi:transcriptional regulator with XRE-family HTH domain